MEDNKSGGKLDKFFAGKGFYIVLALCVIVIGASVWSIASNRGADPVSLDPGLSLDSVPTIKEEDDVTAPVVNTEPPQPVIAEPEPVEDEPVSVPDEPSEPEWVWPVAGDIERGYAMDKLVYDVTMADWRCHDGIDVAADLGAVVKAMGSGTVESVAKDALYGTTVVIDHGDGVKSSYSNLAETPTVNTGDRVSAGDTIGSVGSTALCEIGEPSHLHVSMSKDAASVDPMSYLPG